MEFERHYRTRDVVKILGVDRRTVWKWIKEGKIKAVKLPGRMYVIPESELRRILGRESRSG